LAISRRLAISSTSGFQLMATSSFIRCILKNTNLKRICQFKNTTFQPGQT
jgi:hypothetical protein